MPDSFGQLTALVAAGQDLAKEQAATAVDAIISGGLSDEEIERFLRVMAVKGESIDELVGGATAMRQHVTRVECRHTDAIDTCGTGGDGISTFNVSTAAGIVAAAAGARVAKHGNRTNSRKSGSAEVLTSLGVRIDAPPAVVSRCLDGLGIGFLFAAKLHPAMGRVAPIRKRIGTPTIFNLLGPLANPAGVQRQIIGVPRLHLVPLMAEALRRLGAVRAMVVNGDDGLCDFTITAPSRFAELRDGEITMRTIEPSAAGLAAQPIEALRIDSPQQSAEMIRAIFAGHAGAGRDHTLLNAAAALVVAGLSSSFADGVSRAAAAIDEGKAGRVLEGLVELTNSSVG